MKEKKDLKQILKLSGKSEFLEVMSNTLMYLDKVYINFERFDETKPEGQRKTNQVRIYLDVLDAYVLAKDIFSGKMAILGKRSLKTAKDGGYRYARDVYSRLGGIPAKKLAEKGVSRPDGMSLSRQFKITPGEKMPWVLSAESGPGEEDERGLIVPRYKKPEQIIRIGMTDEQFKMFAGSLELMSQAWINERVRTGLMM